MATEKGKKFWARLRLFAQLANIIFVAWAVWHFGKKAEPAEAGAIRQTVFVVLWLVVTYVVLNLESFVWACVKDARPKKP